ncbi:MAG: SAM-dependent chlorinase/fluorinase [Bacteroidales bacterium]|nr:SAM-dependent chlorinase/fluorinase [Bacteroidales bacterium]
MSIITLTTDWRQNDFYVGAVKGTILKHAPNVSVVDLNHQIPPFNISMAAFVVKNAYGFFPEGTVHIIDVNSEPSENGEFIAFKYHGHYFLCADNGIFGLLFQDEPELTVRILPKEMPIINNRDSNFHFPGDSGTLPEITTFSGLSVFAPAAAYLATTGQLEQLGPVATGIQKQIPLRPAIDESVISGSVIYIDSYQNTITNITRDLFERIGKGRTFEILVQSNYYKIKSLNTWYNETSPGELLALFNSLNLLEIAIYQGNAAELLNLSINSTIRVKFF